MVPSITHWQNVSMTKATNRPPRVAGARPSHFVREWRKFRGYSQERLAEMVGVTHGAISQLETGKTHYTQAMLEALAEALMTEPASLLMRDPTAQDAIWSIWERAKPAQRRQIEAIADTIVKTGTDD